MRILLLPLALLSLIPVQAQVLSILSGNGQIVQEQFLTTVPMVVVAKSADGTPLAGVPLTWTITKGTGTIVRPQGSTDANGQARADFLGTLVQPGLSFQQTIVTAGSSSSSVSFFVTTGITRLAGGGPAPPPLVQLILPVPENRVLSGQGGSTLHAAVAIQVAAQAGPQAGSPIPNVAMRITNTDSDPADSPSGTCSGPGGVALSDSTGTATCDLILNKNIGTANLAAVVGEITITPRFSLTILPGPVCTFSLSAFTKAVSAAGGTGSVGVVTPSGCGWTAFSNANWINITSSPNSSGNGTVNYTAFANSGASRSGTLLIAGLTFIVTQAAAGTPNPLLITTAAGLPNAVVGNFYSLAIQASGGTPPYLWSSSGSLPAGITLDASKGVVSGTPTSAASSSFSVIILDAAKVSQSQIFTLTVLPPSPGLNPTITNTSFPNGEVGTPYRQGISSSGGCVSPFNPSPAISVVDGVLPTGLAVVINVDASYSLTGTPTKPGNFSFTLQVKDTCARIGSTSFTMTVNSVGSTNPAMTASPSSISFAIQANSSAPPANQTINIATGSSNLAYAATVATTGGGNWLTLVGAPAGNTPGTLTVGVVNSATLASGSYTGMVTITSSASNSPVVVPVALTVASAPALNLSTQALSFNLQASGTGTTSQQAISITSANGTPVPFTVTATTASGGNWLTITPNAGSTPLTINAIVTTGVLGVGLYSGSIAIATPGAAVQTVAVTLNLTAPPILGVAPGSLSFSYQQGGPVPTAQIVSVSSSIGAQNFTIASGTATGGTWLNATPSSATTPQSLVITISPEGLAPGSYTGAVNVVSSSSGAQSPSVPVLLTVTLPAPAPTAITNAASFALGPIAPGEFISIFGTNIGPPTGTLLQLDANNLVSTLLADTRVLFDGIPAPLLYVSSTQISAAVPYGIAGRASTIVQVEYKGTLSNPINLRVAEAQPGIFTLDPGGQGAILNQDGTTNSVTNGAEPGSVISFYGTGEGQTSPAGVTGGLISSTLSHPVAGVSVTVGGEPATVTYAGSAPGTLAGFLQVNVQLPTDLTRGAPARLVLKVGTAQSQNGVFVSIKP